MYQGTMKSTFMRRHKKRQRMRSNPPPEIRYEFAVYVDGSCKGNGTENSSMAFGYKFTEIATGVQKEDSGHIGPGTNNLAELLAIKHAFEGIEAYCKTKNYPIRHCSVVVYSDSQFAIKTIEARYKVRHHANVIFALRDLRKFWGKIEYVKIAGHSGHLGNMYADKLAYEAHPKKKVFYVSKVIKANTSDPFDTILSCAEEAVDRPGAEKSFPLKKGKEYEVRILIKEK